jgi:transposase-like protein
MAASNTTDPVDPPRHDGVDRSGLTEAEARRRYQQETVRRVLAAGGNYSDAATEAGVSRRTVARWMSDPTFAKSVSDARAEQVQALTGQLTSLADGAVLVLSEVLVEGTNPERLRAAQMILDWGTRLRRDTELEARLLEVEGRLGLADAGGEDGAR